MLERVASWPGLILTYRWEAAHQDPMLYWVYLDGAGVVRRAHQGMDFVNAPDKD
jgi:hypothetical protein